MMEVAAARRDELLAAAERLFARQGYVATSVRDIADALEMKAGSLYAHIDTKEDLLWELLNAAADRFFSANEPIAHSALVPVEKLRRAIGGHIDVVTSSVDAAAVYSTQWRHLGEPRRGEFAARRDAYERLMRGLVRGCIRDGTFADVDEKFATLVILSAINWIYQWYRPDGPMTPEQIARKLTDLLFNGLRRAET